MNHTQIHPGSMRTYCEQCPCPLEKAGGFFRPVLAVLRVVAGTVGTAGAAPPNLLLILSGDAGHAEVNETQMHPS